VGRREDRFARRNGTVIPGMNAIAFTREVRVVFDAPRRMVFNIVGAAILRGSPRGSHLRRTLAREDRADLPDGQISDSAVQSRS
jgi:hypothetical protein